MRARTTFSAAARRPCARTNERFVRGRISRRTSPDVNAGPVVLRPSRSATVGLSLRNSRRAMTIVAGAIAQMLTPLTPRTVDTEGRPSGVVPPGNGER